MLIFKKNCCWAIAFICIFFNCAVLAQNSIDVPNQILISCYNFNFKTADSLLNNTTVEYKNTTDFELLKSTILWWKIISGEKSTQQKQNYYVCLQNAENKLEKEKTKDFNYIYKGITLYGFYARMDGLNKNYLKAFFRINKCLRFLQTSFGNEEKYNYFYLSSGLYNYYMVNAVKHYPVIAPYLYLYPKGNTNKGFIFLETAANNNNLSLKTEANYFLMKIFLEEKKIKEANSYAQKLTTYFSSNLLFQYYYFNTFIQLNDIKGAELVLKNIYSYTSKNKEISNTQKKYFIDLAEADLKEYFLNKNK
ncbi:MAG: hypothetical protein V4667_08030 [Bacteroidota bacterium]